MADGELQVGGVGLELLAARVGSTPFFAYDRALLDQRVDQLRVALPARVELSYAMKANPMPAVVQHLARRVDRIDVASAPEMQTALDTAMRPDRVSFAGPGKTPAELRQAVAAGIIVEVESPTELTRVVAAGDDLGVTPRVAVRVNPDFAVKGSGMRMGGGPQQFGIDAEQVPAVLADFVRAGVDVLGFHIFAGSQNLHADVIAGAQSRTVDLAADLADHLPSPVRYLNLGGGFGIPYVDRDRPLDLDAVARRSFMSSSTARCASRLPEAIPSSSWAATSSASAESMSRAWSTARSPAARPTSSSTAGCTTSSRHRATSGRRSAGTIRWWSATGSPPTRRSPRP